MQNPLKQKGYLAMRIMFDTNIVLDALLKREPFWVTSSHLMRLCLNGSLQGYLTASSLTDLYYLIHKNTHDKEITYDAIGKLLDVFNIASVTSQHIQVAYKKHAKDFEDCLLAVCASSVPCDYIVTRNQKDFAGLNVFTISPEELINQLQ